MSLRPDVPPVRADERPDGGLAVGRRPAALAVGSIGILLAATAAVAVLGAGAERPGEAAVTAFQSSPDRADAPQRLAARAALSDLAHAWRDVDRRRFVAVADDTDAAARWARTTWRRLGALGVRGLDLRYAGAAAVPPSASGVDSAATVDVTWTQPGWVAPATTRLTVDFADDSGAARGSPAAVVGSRAAAGSPAPLWGLPLAQVVNRPGCTLVVLAAGGSSRPGPDRTGSKPRRPHPSNPSGSGFPGGLRTMVATARDQVDAVLADRAALPGARLVVVAPGSAAEFGQVVGGSAADYPDIAAVTTTVDGSVHQDAAEQVVLNPAVFDSLDPVGAQVVLTHEATHAASGAAAASMPLWVAEGFADYVALHDGGVPLRVAAVPALRTVRRDGPPATLPGAGAFAVGSHGLGRAYAQAWLAFRLVGRRDGDAAAVAFYDRVLAGRPVDAALRDTTGFDVTTLTAQWRAELIRLARVTR